MTSRIIVAKPSDKATEVIKIMNHKNISQVPVVDGDNVIGLVSETSALENSEKLNKLVAKDIMEEAPPIVSINASLSVVSSLLKHYSLVLVKRKGVLVGVITKSDLLRKAFT
ncbi:CBS domain-containing protein [Candidatus Woesearchaeota archaeon]|nr:CBS domain-containing protein [Candidatus Woesearchaeota archaeon]